MNTALMTETMTKILVSIIVWFCSLYPVYISVSVGQVWSALHPPHPTHTSSRPLFQKPWWIQEIVSGYKVLWF